MNVKNIEKQAGFNLVELSYVLLVVGIIVAGIIGTGALMKGKGNVDKSSRFAQALITNLQEYYQGSSTGYAGVDNTTANNIKAIPKGMKTNGTTQIYSQFGGAINIAPNTIDVVDDSVAVTYARLPAGDICSKFVKKLSDYVDVIKVGGSTVKQDQQEIDLNALSEQCKTAADVTLIAR